MRTRPVRGAVLAALVVVALTSAQWTSARAGRPRSAEVLRRIVAFTDLPADVIDRLRSAGITHAAVFEAADAVAVIGPASAMSAIGRWPDVVAVERERAYKPLLYRTKTVLGVDKVHAGVSPLPSAFTGHGVTAALVDTGVNPHPDLDDRIAAHLDMAAAGALDPITDGDYSRTHTERPFGTDEFIHGTGVAGIIAGSGASARGDDDMRGIAPDATLVSLDWVGADAWTGLTPEAQLLAYNLGLIWTDVNILASYQWLIDHQHDAHFPGGIRVVNNSYGAVLTPEDTWPIAMDRMIDSALDAGMILVFAAGNTGPDANTVNYPGSRPDVITVGAICSPGIPNDGTFCEPGEVARLSSRGPALDVVAPGIDVWAASAIPGLGFSIGGGVGYPPSPGSGDPIAEANNRLRYYGLYAGTSFAAPHVTGIVALMLEANPALTHEQIESILRETATDLGPTGFDESYGHGLVDAFAAVRMAEELAAP